MTLHHRLRAAAGNSGGGIFQDIKSLATSLGSATLPSPSNLQNIQSLIEAQNSAFNVFAVIGKDACAENLTRQNNVSGGKSTLTGLGFNANSSGGNIISTGNEIVDMDGGSSEGLSAIDGKKWMAMAQFDGGNFDGILIWVFIGGNVGSVDINGNQGTGTSTAHRGRQSLWTGQYSAGLYAVRDIFYPSGTQDTDMLNIHPVAIDPSGTIYSNTTAGKVGWNFSNNSQAASTGYLANNTLSQDDGIFAFAIPTGTNSSYSDGDGGGLDPFTDSSATKPAFGMGNRNSNDASCDFVYWNNTKTPSSGSITQHTGFLFSGDG